VLDTAATQIATFRAYVGALQNRLTSAIGAISARQYNETIALGRITDADFSKETQLLIKKQILHQVSSNILVDAQKAKQLMLALL
jgi:flagellin